MKKRTTTVLIAVHAEMRLGVEQSKNCVQRLTFSLFFCNIVDLLVDELCI